MKIVLPTESCYRTSWFRGKTPLDQEFSIRNKEVFGLVWELWLREDELVEADMEALYEAWLEGSSPSLTSMPPALCFDSDEFRDLSSDIRMGSSIREGFEVGRELHEFIRARW